MDDANACPCCASARAPRSAGTRGDGVPVVRCGDCGAGWVPAGSLPAVPYGEAYFAEQNPGYFNEVAAQVATPGNLGDMVLDRAARRMRLSGARLLDVGCASGVLLATARRRGLEVAGVEVSAYAAARASAELGLDIFCGTVTDYPAVPASFDIVTMMDVLEHIRVPGPHVERVAALLRPGGLLFVMTPNYAARQVFGDHWHGYNASYEHVLYLDRGSLARLLRRTGFEVLTAETFGMVRLLEYYWPGQSAWLPQRVRSLLNRVLSNKLLRPLGLEHRLLVAARKCEDL